MRQSREQRGGGTLAVNGSLSLFPLLFFKLSVLQPIDWGARETACSERGLIWISAGERIVGGRTRRKLTSVPVLICSMGFVQTKVLESDLTSTCYSCMCF